MSNLNNEQKAIYAILADNVYWDVRYGYKTVDNQQDFNNSNWTPVPDGWTVIGQYDESGSGKEGKAMSPKLGGLSARVFQKTGTNEVVISFAGTDDGVDWVHGNVPSLLGVANIQLSQAAVLYERVRQDKALQGANITFTGHSLGGGIASVLGVWFDKPAVVFDPAPFKQSAINQDFISINAVA